VLTAVAVTSSSSSDARTHEIVESFYAGPAVSTDCNSRAWPGICKGEQL